MNIEKTNLLAEINTKSMFTQEYLCLNPNCTHNQTRFVHKYQLHQECKKWMLPLDYITTILEPQRNQPTLYQSECNVFQFQKSPLLTILLMDNIFPQQNSFQLEWSFQTIPTAQKDPLLVLQFNFDQILMKVQTKLQKVFIEVSDRVIKIKQIKNQVITEIKQTLKLSQRTKIQQRINKSQVLVEFDKLSQILGKFTLIQQEKIAKQINTIFESIQSIGRSFWNNQLQSVKKEKQLFQKVKGQIQKYKNDLTVPPVTKLQSLIPKSYHKTIEPKISEDKLSVQVICGICQKVFEGQGHNLKQKKNSAYCNLVSHILSDHQAETTEKLTEKLMKDSSNKISYNDFISQIEEKAYDEYIIVDKQNKNKDLLPILNSKINQKTFLLEVVSFSTQNLAWGKYMIAKSQVKDSADILIIMIIFSIITSGFYRFSRTYENTYKPKIIVVTQDHFADSLKQILNSQFGVQLEIWK